MSSTNGQFLIQRHRFDHVSLQNNRFHFPKRVQFPVLPPSSISQFGDSRFLVCKCASDEFSGSFERDSNQDGLESNQMAKQKKGSIVDILKQSNSILPHVVLASAILALVHPPSFSWFTSRIHFKLSFELLFEEVGTIFKART